jgi:hypothetical protein
MLDLLDLAWVDGRSFWLGVLSAYTVPWLAYALVVGVYRAFLILGRRRADRAAIRTLTGGERSTATRSW